MNGVGGEVDVVREENDVVVGVGVALTEKLVGGEAVFNRRRREVHDRRRRRVQLGF